MLGMEEGSNKRRPFFTSPDEMLEEYYDEQLPGKKRRLTTEQVTSLTEKLKVKNLSPEGAMLLNKDNQAAQATASENMDIHVQAQQQLQQQKIEDRLSTGSGGSAVVDGEGAQLVDSSGESYFQESYQGGCGGGLGIHSEEDEASDEGCSYLPAEMFPDSHNNEGWWVWN